MKKKITLVILLALLLLAGCGNEEINSSPESVSKEMAKRLSNGNYENITELLAVDGKSFIDESSFRGYLSENNLIIEGNSKYEIMESTKITEESTSSTVKIKIDDNKVLKINTVKKDDKWYVDLGSYEFDENLIIKVPTGATVKLNGTKLDYNKYGTTDEYDRYWSIGSNRYNYTQSIDIYTIPSLLKGKYDLQVEHPSIITFNEEIYSNKTYYKNYMAEDDRLVFNSDSDSYVVFVNTSDSLTNELKSFVSNYYNDVMKQAEGQADFSTISKYFDSSNSTLTTTYKKSYETLSKSMEDTTYSTWITYNSNLKGTFSYDDDNDGVYYVNEGRYIVVAHYEMSYTATTKYKSFFYKDKEDEVEDKKIEKAVVVGVIQNNNGEFVIDGGIKIIPSFRSYE